MNKNTELTSNRVKAGKELLPDLILYKTPMIIQTFSTLSFTLILVADLRLPMETSVTLAKTQP